MRLLLATLLFATTLHAAEIQGTVIAVSDGDTITVLTPAKTQHKIRLTGIDAPEKMQPFGRRSKSSLSDMVYLKEVTVETDKKDRYGRNLGKVLIDGNDANLMQIERGFAWHYKAYERDQSSVDRKARKLMLKTQPEPLGWGCGLIRSLCCLWSLDEPRNEN